MNPARNATTTTANQTNSSSFALILVTALFFLWGFAHNLDPILIPHLQKSFTLSTTQATLVDSAVFAAYFLFALPAGLIMKRFGYQAGIVVGLFIFAVGCYLFVPAANLQSYTFFLCALFIIACGLTTLETAANPYITVLGHPQTATFRLNLAQSFNGLATALAPVIGVRVIITHGNTDEQLAAMSETARKVALASEAASVKTPYIILGSVLLVMALLFVFIKLPDIRSKAPAQQKGKGVFHALRHRHLAWGVATQFAYVGAQVCVFSLFLLYAPEAAGISEQQAGDYLGVCGVAFLLGRFLGTLLMKYIRPQKLLALYAAINTVLCLPAIFGSGMLTIYTIVAICFFMSIMFPTIFALGIQDLGADTEYGSSLLIMSIVGGAIIPRVFGQIADSTGDIQLGYVVPMVCFAFIIFYGWKGHRVSRKEVENIPAPVL